MTSKRYRNKSLNSTKPFQHIAIEIFYPCSLNHNHINNKSFQSQIETLFKCVKNHTKDTKPLGNKCTQIVVLCELCSFSLLFLSFHFFLRVNLAIVMQTKRCVVRFVCRLGVGSFFLPPPILKSSNLIASRFPPRANLRQNVTLISPLSANRLARFT